MNKAEIYQFLKENGVSYEAAEHEAVFNMEQLDSLELPYPELNAKNLFVRDDKKKNYYLITVKGGKRVDLGEFRRAYGLRRLSFASLEELMSVMKLTPGSVTPMGLLNDMEHKVNFYLDAEFTDSLIGIHPNENTATIWIKSQDLIRIIKEHGNEVEIFRI